MSSLFNLRRWLPNAISLIRLLLVIPYSWLFLTHTDRSLIFGLAFVIILSDKLDGWLARRFRVESKSGEALDGFADGAFILISWVLFYREGLYDFKFLVLLLAPRILIGISLLLYRALRGQWNAVHFFGGKIGGVANFVVILWLILKFPYALPILWIMIFVNYLGVIISELERFKIFTLTRK